MTVSEQSPFLQTERGEIRLFLEVRNENVWLVLGCVFDLHRELYQPLVHRLF